ncbi:CC0125/CC1285 family lipoprotein [Candidatus Avelusimicrobium luingense]|uniref:CC0125/CC1285 family lipoprotein n=1 Tax=Candidatus Avelusimicrobium luingense TaxID=3416211 RepID=UPI003D0AF713
MKKIFLMMCALALLSACATPYKQAKKETSNGFFDTKLQDGMYEVLFNGNENTSARKANDFALLRAAEVCLENGYQSFEIVRKTEDFTEKEVDTGIKIFGGTLSSLENAEPKITLVIRCSKKTDLLYKAQELKTNLRERYKLK